MCTLYTSTICDGVVWVFLYSCVPRLRKGVIQRDSEVIIWYMTYIIVYSKVDVWEMCTIYTSTMCDGVVWVFLYSYVPRPGKAWSRDVAGLMAWPKFVVSIFLTGLAHTYIHQSLKQGFILFPLDQFMFFYVTLPHPLITTHTLRFFITLSVAEVFVYSDSLVLF